MYEKLLVTTKIQQGKSKTFLNSITIWNPFKNSGFLMQPTLSNHPHQKQEITLKI